VWAATLRYSAARRATSAPTEGISSISPTPCPALQMSRHALSPLGNAGLKSPVAGGRLSGSRPRATIDPRMNVAFNPDIRSVIRMSEVCWETSSAL
jgi:hypothetical protein